MKVMVFVIDNLNVGNKEIENFVSNKNLTILYEKWNKMYILSRLKEFSESDLEKLKVSN